MSPTCCPLLSTTSSSGGQPPLSASSQNAGQTPVPTGIFARISKYPYFCENQLWVVSMPEVYSLLNSTGLSAGGVRLSTIERIPPLTLNASSPSVQLPRPPQTPSPYISS